VNVINIYSQNRIIGVVNQIANPLQKGDIVEVLNKYYDPNTVGEWVYSVRVLKSSNEEVSKYHLNSVMLVACYKIDIL
jgi:hypothetical protein